MGETSPYHGAMVVLSSAMVPEEIQNLLSCKTSQEMWTKLQMIHEERSEVNKLSLVQRFHACKMEPHDTVIKFIARIQNLERQIEDVGEKISEKNIMAKILSRLPSKFGPFCSA